LALKGGSRGGLLRMSIWLNDSGRGGGGTQGPYRPGWDGKLLVGGPPRGPRTFTIPHPPPGRGDDAPPTPTFPRHFFGCGTSSFSGRKKPFWPWKRLGKGPPFHRGGAKVHLGAPPQPKGAIADFHRSSGATVCFSWEKRHPRGVHVGGGADFVGWKFFPEYFAGGLGADHDFLLGPNFEQAPPIPQGYSREKGGMVPYFFGCTGFSTRGGPCVLKNPVHCGRGGGGEGNQKKKAWGTPPGGVGGPGRPAPHKKGSRFLPAGLGFDSF